MEEVKKTYTDAQKRATKKYRENNKDKVNEQRKKYYQNRKAKDPTFLQYKRNKAKEYYQKKKANKMPKTEEKVLEEVKEELKNAIPIELVEIVENIKDEPVKEIIIKEIIEHPTIDETVVEKKKRKYTKKNKN